MDKLTWPGSATRSRQPTHPPERERPSRRPDNYGPLAFIASRRARPATCDLIEGTANMSCRTKAIRSAANNVPNATSMA